MCVGVTCRFGHVGGQNVHVGGQNVHVTGQNGHVRCPVGPARCQNGPLGDGAIKEGAALGTVQSPGRSRRYKSQQ